MNWKSLLIASIIFSFGSSAFCQEEGTASASRKKNLRQLFDYRYKGGFYSFERKFNNTVKYPEFARMNCIMGIVVLEMVVDCEGNPKHLSMKTSLGYGINEELSNLFNATQGEWNKCEDEKYTRFEIPIQFRIEGTETNTEDAIFIVEGDMPGHTCNDDNYYRKKAEKALEKEQGKKALKYMNLLIKRDPYNTKYRDMKNQAIALMK